VKHRSISKYTWAITTAPSEGVGLGRHIEESVQNSTGENLDPYGSRGGNDTVDVRGILRLHGQVQPEMFLQDGSS
jgi:hypothetical protein